MTKQNVSIAFETIPEVVAAAQFLAELVRQGVTFEASTKSNSTLVVEFNGGF